MTEKTVHVCDRCGKEEEAGIRNEPRDWVVIGYLGNIEHFCKNCGDGFTAWKINPEVVWVDRGADKEK